MRFQNFRICCLLAVVMFVLAIPATADDKGSSSNSGSSGGQVEPPDPCRKLGLTADNGDRDDDDWRHLCTAVIRQNEKFIQQDFEHLRVILEFTRKNPNLRAHLLTLLQDPTPGNTVQANGDGTWLITVPVKTPCPSGNGGGTGISADAAACGPTYEKITTSGLSAKLSGIFRSVVFADDLGAQLKLYTEAYNHLPEGFRLPGEAVLPSPSSLHNLKAVGNALTLLGSAWQSIIPLLPPPTTPPSTASCDSEIGSTPQYAAYGDRTGNSNSCTPSATGLFGTLKDANFPLRQYLTCVKQQGNRETCHSFSDISAAEMAISRDHGVKVNLSEQDLMEHYRTLWSPGYEHETGDAFEELTGAINHNYSFALESSWDYNPSYGRSFDASTGVYVNSCMSYPGSEPGCSDSAPQAPGLCIGISLPIFLGLYVPFPICSLHDAGVPEYIYKPTSLTSFWNSSDTELSKEYMILSIAFNQAVVLGFNVTNNFYNGGNGGYVVYDANDVTTNVGGHYVHVVGIAGNDELPAGAPKAVGGGYFIIKNSWNNCFGDAGYLYLDWDYVKAVGWAGFNVGVN